ncbi:hypothetical protein CLU95_2065 [Variovorax sp. 54]|uniref:hypothetical protein n=1 Tax=Variovorax sp. 54 TaxID=2035212 RepID=UPI000C182766|nr:hypothetical protein [Variovorax sp. 54]PIF74928.1 hypothetical protein CLU95_2065 [Variovorax sp. 54]
MFDFLKKAPKEEPAGRASPDHSAFEINNAKLRTGKELRAVLYLYEDRTYIVSSTTSIAETGTPTVLDASASDDQIGLVICDKLLDAWQHDLGDIRGHKQDDWQVLKASGAKTGRQFNENSLYMVIETINSAISFTMRYRVTLEPSFHAGAILSNGVEHEQIGITVRRLVAAARALRKADIF